MDSTTTIHVEQAAVALLRSMLAGLDDGASASLWVNNAGHVNWSVTRSTKEQLAGIYSIGQTRAECMERLQALASREGKVANILRLEAELAQLRREALR